MGQRYLISKDLAAGANSGWTRVRRAPPVYLFEGTGGYTGNVTIQHTVDGGTTTSDLGVLASGDHIDIQHPIREVRVKGDHSAGTATIAMVEEY